MEGRRRHDSRDSSSTTTSSRPSTPRRSSVVEGNPDGWLFIDFCQTFEKLAQPLARTGKWDPAKSFGSDTLNDCSNRGTQNYPGMRATQANASSGASFPAFKALFEKEGQAGRQLPVVHRRGVRQRLHRLLAALEAKSSDPAEIAKHVVSVTNDPGEKYTFEQLDDAIKAVLAGKKIHFVGATGDLNFSANGRITARPTTSGSTRPTAREGRRDDRVRRASRPSRSEPAGRRTAERSDPRRDAAATRAADRQRPHHRNDPGADRASARRSSSASSASPISPTANT